MSFIDRLFGRRNANEAVRPLYNQVVAEGRAPHWYREGGVPDTIDGRFEMIAAILALVIARLELEPEQRQNVAWLVELFVHDMDSQLREIGIGDMVVGKHVGKMMGALGGRIGAYREGLREERPRRPHQVLPHGGVTRSRQSARLLWAKCQCPLEFSARCRDVVCAIGRPTPLSQSSRFRERLADTLSQHRR